MSIIYAYLALMSILPTEASNYDIPFFGKNPKGSDLSHKFSITAVP